jgi:signal transduction histidine kinase
MILVKNVLILSNIKDRSVDHYDIPLHGLLETSSSKASELFPNKKPHIKIEMKEEGLSIKAEPIVEEIFFNIISNSIKFDESEEPIIEINAFAEQQNAVIEISDRGPGMPDDMKLQLFNRFERSGDRIHTGIGLSLVKVLVTRYNGTIGVYDRIEGDFTEGTKMVIKLPRT